jgi:cytochrome c-type biogenesis protein CcmE
MLKKLVALLFASVLVVWMTMPGLAQEGSKKEEASETPAQEKAEKAEKKAGKEGRWEGVVARSNTEKSTLTVRQRSTGAEKTVVYDSSTKWSAAEHHGKPTEIDPTQVKDGDRIIATGKWEKGGSVLHATSISKRLTQH